MEKIKGKKIAVLTILIAIIMIFYANLTRSISEVYRRGKTVKYIYNKVYLFSLDFTYNGFVLFFMLLMVFGIYLFFFRTDEHLKKIFDKERNFFKKILDRTSRESKE